MSSKVMRLDSILGSISSNMEKTASDNSNASKSGNYNISQAKQELLNTLSNSSMEKVASNNYQQTPVEDLEKIAHQVAAAEEEALEKQAQFYGAAVCDGFMQRMSQYEKVAQELGHAEPNTVHVSQFEKVASDYFHDDEGTIYSAQEVHEAVYGNQSNDTMEKFAHESFPNVDFDAFDLQATQDLIKQASYQGINLTEEEAIEKLASDAFSAGYQEMMEKCAAEVAEVGYTDMMEKAAELAANDGFTDMMEKAAELAIEQGYFDTMELCVEKLAEVGSHDAIQELQKVAHDMGYQQTMEKFAHSAFDHGYNDMDQLLG